MRVLSSGMNARGYLLAIAAAGCAFTITACSSTPDAASSAPACQAWASATSSGLGTTYALTQIADTADGPVKPLMQAAVATIDTVPAADRAAAFSAVRDQCAAAGVAIPTELHTTLHLQPASVTH